MPRFFPCAFVCIALLAAVPTADAGLELVFSTAPPAIFSITDTDGVGPPFVPDVNVTPALTPFLVDVVWNASAAQAVPLGASWDFAFDVADPTEVTIGGYVPGAGPSFGIVSAIAAPGGGVAVLLTNTGVPHAHGTVFATFTVTPLGGTGVAPDDEMADMVLASGTGLFFPLAAEAIEDHVLGGPLPLGMTEGFDAQAVPEPSSRMLLAMASLVMFGGWSWKRWRARAVSA